jgi:predicted nucleotidyltransferase
MIDQKCINEVVHRLVNVYDPVKIYLFGSYAWGHPDEESDLDLIVIIDTSEEKRHRRSIPGFKALWDLDISKDLMVFTREEFEHYAKDATTLCHKVSAQGKIIYARA